MAPSGLGGTCKLPFDRLRSTLAAARQDASIEWIVAFHHYPLWSDGEHGSNLALQRIWGPVYDEYRVEVVVQGHDHLYERTKTMRGGQVAEAGTTFVTVGMGGASHYAFRHAEGRDVPWEAARDNEHYGLLRLTFLPGALEGRFVALDGNAKDAWRVEHDDQGLARPGPLPEDDASGGGSPEPKDESQTPGPTEPLLLLVLAATVLLGRRARA